MPAVAPRRAGHAGAGPAGGRLRRRLLSFTLDRLTLGQRGRIVGLSGDAGLVQRLMEMGMLEGDEVELVGVAPLGDPIEVRLGDSRLSLRRNEAARVEVQPLP